MSDAASLWSLFAGSFLAATLLPMSSEALLFALLALDVSLMWPALWVATAGNTLGGMTSYLIGRLIPGREAATAMQWVRRWGCPASGPTTIRFRSSEAGAGSTSTPGP